MTNESVQQAGDLLGRLDATHEQESGDFGEAWKYKQEPKLEGRVVRLAEMQDEDREPFQIVEVERADGTRISVFGDKAMLRKAIERERPQVGARVAFGYYGLVEPKGGGNPWGDFALVVDRQGGAPPPDEHDAGPRRRLRGEGSE